MIKKHIKTVPSQEKHETFKIEWHASSASSKGHTLTNQIKLNEKTKSKRIF